MNPALDQILSSIKSLEPLPQVALRVSEMARQDDVVPRDLAGLIQTDAALTAKVLRLCNSAYYGFQREICTLEEASNLLGTRALTNLVLTSCTGRWFKKYGSSSAASRQRLWERSVTNALAAGLLARLDGEVDRNRAYTAGLLQNIGHLVLDRHLDPAREQVLEAVQAGADLVAAEQEVLGIHHAEVGARLAERWSFPAVLVDTIRHHHQPSLATEDPGLTTVAQLGEHVTSALEEGDGLASMMVELADFALDLEGLGGFSCGEVVDMLRSELERAREFVEV